MNTWMGKWWRKRYTSIKLWDEAKFNTKIKTKQSKKLLSLQSLAMEEGFLIEKVGDPLL